jgi:hypothetical protein
METEKKYLRNNGQIFPTRENYKLIDPRCATKAKEKKHETNSTRHIKIKLLKTSSKRKILKSEDERQDWNRG